MVQEEIYIINISQGNNTNNTNNPMASSNIFANIPFFEDNLETQRLKYGDSLCAVFEPPPPENLRYPIRILS
jgi:hypothetical protein